MKEQVTHPAVTPTIEMIEKGAAGLSYTVSGTTVIMGFNAEEWGIIGIIVGIILGVATFGFNAWFRWKYLRPEK